jgi:calcineurin-like phosphoesterase family protein
MTNRVFITPDTHFGHKRVIEFEAAHRPFASIEEHDRELIARWNATVNPKDTVWHLGDVFFGGRHNHWPLAQLHGIKRLVLGNHDAYPLEVYQQYFTKIYGVAEYRHCVLSHVPVNPNQFPRYERNLHGHMHSKKLDDPRYICVSVEQWDLRPVLVDSLLNSC